MNTLFWHSLMAFGAGISLNLMPCVLPVIPIKVQVILGELEDRYTARMAAAAALLAGSLLFFVTLGAFTAYLGLMWGALFQSRIFLGVMVLFFWLGAVSLFTDFGLKLPQGLYRLPLQRYSGAFLIGGLAGLLATPCGGPLLGVVLAYALTQPPPVILMIFFLIGAGVAFPYGLILIWPRLGRRIFRNGPGAPKFKRMLGFGLLAGGLFFAQSLLPVAWHRPLWALLLGSLAAWAVRGLLQRAVQGARMVPFLALSLALTGGTLLAMPQTGAELSWQPYSSPALAEAQAAGKPVLIEFTAEWCLNCKVLEQTTFANRDLIRQAQRMDLATHRIDMTQVTSQNRKLLARYGGTVLPFVVLLDRRGEIAQRFSGLFTPETLENALKELETGRQ